jgi:superfamily II DNA or RNA helicase
MSLEEQVRAALSPALRERAQVYAREGGVVRVAAAPDEAAYLVTVPGARAPFEVTLWPNEPDWACTCGAPALCAHVAAAWYLHAAGPAAPPPTVTVARVRYRFTRAAPFLLLDRDVPANALRRDVDSEMNRVFAGWWGRKGSPKGLMQRALAVLAGVPEGDITLDGAPVRCDGRPVLPRILVQDHGGGFRVRLVRADGIDEAFADGVLRMGSTLRPIGEADLDPAYARRLQEGIVYDRVAAEALVTTDLPKLRKLLEVDVRTERLPERVDVPPRIAFEVRADGGRARVVPRLVYGEPAVARVERGEVWRLGRATPVRDLVAESALVRRLAEAGMSFDVPVERTGAGAALWARQLPQWARAEVLRHAPSLRVEELTDAPTVRAIPIDGGWQVDVDAGGVDPQALVAAWQAGEPLVPLLGGGWRTLPRHWLETHGHVLAELLSARDAAGRVTRAAGPMLMEALGALDAPVPADLQALRALAGDFDAIPDVPLPSGFRAALRPYQQRGVAWLSWLRSVGMGGILADDMGLGKTVQTLAALAVSGGPALVVAPTSVLRNWANEAARFAPDLRVCVYWGPRRQLDPSADLVITTYAVLRLDLEALAARRWRTVVLDEAQAIKNPESQAAQAAYRLDADLRLALTGTPVENRLEELWSAFHFVTPGLLGGRKAFRERFSGPIERGDRRAQQTLRARIRPFVLRRLKSEVARDLPPRTDVVLRCALSDEERAIYESVRTLGREDVARLLAGGRTLQVLEILLRMRQAACHTGLLPGKGAASSAKVDLLLETLDQVLSEGHRALVFSQWTSLLDLLEAPLRARGLAWARLDGSTRDRAGEVERFNAPDGPPLFLLSLKAGGTGLNLTAADYVFHLDPWWNPAVEDQATDRAHRIGQDRPVVSCRIIADDTVEERILELQERKRSLARAALDEDALAQALTRDDLLALFD